MCHRRWETLVICQIFSQLCVIYWMKLDLEGPDVTGAVIVRKQVDREGNNMTILIQMKIKIRPYMMTVILPVRNKTVYYWQVHTYLKKIFIYLPTQTFKKMFNIKINNCCYRFVNFEKKERSCSYGTYQWSTFFFFKIFILFWIFFPRKEISELLSCLGMMDGGGGILGLEGTWMYLIKWTIKTSA